MYSRDSKLGTKGLDNWERYASGDFIAKRLVYTHMRLTLRAIRVIGLSGAREQAIKRGAANLYHLELLMAAIRSKEQNKGIMRRKFQLLSEAC